MTTQLKNAPYNENQMNRDWLQKSAAYTLTPQDTMVRGDTTGAAFTLTTPAPEKCSASGIFVVQANKPGANSLTVAFTGVAPDGSQVIAVDEGYAAFMSLGFMWIVLGAKLA